MASYRSWKYAVPPFRTPTILSVTGENVDWPATNILLDFIPRRPFRTLAKAADQVIVYDFGSAVEIPVILLNRTNYSRVKFEYSSDNSSYTNIAPSGYDSNSDGLLVPVDGDVNRRKLVLENTGINHRYVRQTIVGAQTTDDGANYYWNGGITFGATWDQIDLPMQLPMDVSFPKPANVRDFPSAGKQINELADIRAVISIGGLYIDSVAKSKMRAIQKVGMSPIIFYPNMRDGDSAVDQFDPSIAYLARRIGDAVRRYDNIPELYTASYVFDEVV